MRQVAYVAVLLVLSASAPAQVPRFLTYSGRLTDGTGWGQSTTADLVITLYDAETGGNVVFRGLHQGAKVSDGYFTVSLGMCDENGYCEPNPANAEFPAALPAALWIGVAVDDEPEMQPRKPVGSVPYAIEARRVGGP
ncbi:MAG: hypothetical protein FJ087_22495, partial [Deltaproteobacteria bacterium]|nr:hypothetical protein [Deltaproteobacteria bacterium]